MYIWPYFQTRLPFLDIRRGKTPNLQQKVSLFLAIKDHLLMIFDGKSTDFASYKAALYSHPIQTKKNGIIFVVHILAREFYMHVLIFIQVFPKLNPRYHGNGPKSASKTSETPTSMVYIAISQNLSQIRNFRLSTLLWANARCLQSASLNNYKQENIYA